MEIPEHDHFLLSSQVDETSLVLGGGLDTLTTTYSNVRGSIIDFIPESPRGQGIPLNHSHGILGYRLSNSFTATFGNVDGIGEEKGAFDLPDKNYGVEDDSLTATVVYEGTALVPYGSGTTEIGGFGRPGFSGTIPDRYVGFGTIGTSPFSTLQTTRRVTYTLDMTGYDVLYILSTTGNDDNGGERVNDPGEGLYVDFNKSGLPTETLRLMPSGQDFNAENGFTGFSDPGGYDETYASWKNIEINIPDQYKTDDVQVTFRQGPFSTDQTDSDPRGEFRAALTIEQVQANPNAGDAIGFLAIGLRQGSAVPPYVPGTPGFSDDGDVCTNYSITSPPPFNITSGSSNGTLITIVTEENHNMDVGGFITISGSTEPWDGNYVVIEVISPTEFTAQKDPNPPSGNLPAGSIVREADGILVPRVTQENPVAYVVDSATTIGGKEVVVLLPDALEERYEVELPADGTSFSRSAADAGSGVVKLRFRLGGSGGAGGNSSSNGGNGGNASVTFTLDSTSHTLIAYGGQGGKSGSSGGAGGNGGGVSIPAALLSDDRVTVDSTRTGDGGGTGGDESTDGGSGGTSIGIEGSGGDGTGESFSYNENETYGPYNSNGSTTITNTDAITSCTFQISGGAGGRGNTNANSGCTTQIGGSSSNGRLVTGTYGGALGYALTYYVGQQGAQGFNDQSYGTVEAVNNGGGQGAPGGFGGGSQRGALGNGATGGAGGGASGIYFGGVLVAGAGGGGGGGGSGGGSNGGGWDGCYSGGNGAGPALGFYGGSALQFNSGAAGGFSGCTAGSGGGGGGGCGPSGGGAGGAGGSAGAGHGGFGGGSGGRAGRSAYNNNYVSAASESSGSSGGGYVSVTVTRTVSGINPSGGGGGAGGYLSVEIDDPDGGLSTGISGSIGGPGTSGGDDGSRGGLSVEVFGILEGSDPVVGITVPAGRKYPAPGYPGIISYEDSPSTVGAGIWHSSSEKVDVIAASAGTFPVAPTALHSGKVTKLINFTGAGNRFLLLGPFDMTSVNTIYFDIIRGNNSNGGESPDENLNLYWKTAPNASTATLLDGLVTTAASSSTYETYSYTVPEESPMRATNIYLLLEQQRSPAQGDNDDPDVDNYGLAQVVTTFNPVTELVFEPSTNATLPGNAQPGCGTDDGIDVVRREVSARDSRIVVEDGTFTLSPSVPISVNSSVQVVDPIPLITKYHRVKYLIKAR